MNHSDIIKPKELEHSIRRFLGGWLEYLSYKDKSEIEKESAEKKVNEFVSINITSLHIVTPEK